MFFLFVLVIIISVAALFPAHNNVSASITRNKIPIGHYDGTWKLMYPAPTASARNICIVPSWFCTSGGQSSQSLCDKLNEFISTSKIRSHHHHHRVFPSSEGNLQLKSIFNVTSSSISTDLNLIQGNYLEPGRMREFTSTSQKYSGTGKCLLPTTSDSSSTVCTNFAQGFLGFWEEENNGYFYSEETDDGKNKTKETVDNDFVRFEQVFITTMKSQENNRLLKRSKSRVAQEESDDDQKSFRQLLNPDLWSMKEEETFSQCVWITSWKSKSSNQNEESAKPNRKNQDNYYIQLSNLFRLQTLFFEEEEESEEPGLHRLRPSKAQEIEGIAIGLCNSSSTSRSFFLTVSHLEADTTRYDQRMIAATWFAGLTVVSAILNAYSIFSLGTIARRSLQVQRSLSFATLLWIVSIDLLFLGVFQLLARQLTPRAARVVYLGMFIRVLTFYIGGVPLILSVRKTQQDFLVAADRGGRWLVAELSVWRYFGMILAFTITLFLLAERMLSWPVILFFSSFFYPQIVQNVVEDEATQPIPQFTWGVFMSVCLPVCAITGAGTFSNLMNSESFFFFLNQHPFAFKARTASAVAFALSLFVQAVILHLQVRYGPRCFIPSYFLPPKYPYEVDAKTVKFVAPESSKTVDELNKRDLLIDKTTTCSICQGLLRVDPNSSEEEDQEENIDEDATKAESSLDRILEESTATSTVVTTSQDATKMNACENVPILWKTPCDHFFHANCLKPWLEVRLVCPVCRELVPKP